MVYLYQKSKTFNVIMKQKKMFLELPCLSHYPLGISNVVSDFPVSYTYCQSLSELVLLRSFLQNLQCYFMKQMVLFGVIGFFFSFLQHCPCFIIRI